MGVGPGRSLAWSMDCGPLGAGGGQLDEGAGPNPSQEPHGSPSICKNLCGQVQGVAGAGWGVVCPQSWCRPEAA